MNNATAVNRPGYAKKKLEKAGRLLMMLILISFAAIMLLPFFLDAVRFLQNAAHGDDFAYRVDSKRMAS